MTIIFLESVRISMFGLWERERETTIGRFTPTNANRVNVSWTVDRTAEQRVKSSLLFCPHKMQHITAETQSLRPSQFCEFRLYQPETKSTPSERKNFLAIIECFHYTFTNILPSSWLCNGLMFLSLRTCDPWPLSENIYSSQPATYWLSPSPDVTQSFDVNKLWEADWMSDNVNEWRTFDHWNSFWFPHEFEPETTITATNVYVDFSLLYVKHERDFFLDLIMWHNAHLYTHTHTKSCSFFPIEC